MMDRGDTTISIIVYVMAFSLIGAFTFLLYDLVVNPAQKEYLESSYPDNVAYYENVITDKTNDFFVLNNDDQIYHVVVDKTDKGYTHSEDVVTEDSKGLHDMYIQSMQGKAAPKPKRSVVPIPIFLNK